MGSSNNDFYNAALDAFQAGRLELALQAAEDALVEDAKDVEAWQLYIFILNSLGRTDDAKQAGGKLRELGVPEVDLICMEAVEAMAAGDAGKAVELYHAAIGLRPDRVELLGSLALAMLETGEGESAIAAARAGANLASEDGQAHYILGRILRLCGRMDEALVALNRAVELDPGLMMAVYELGMVLAAADRLEEAAAKFETFLGVHPGDESATQALDAMRARIGQMTRTY